MLEDNAVRDGKSESCAPPGSLGAEERLKSALPRLFVHACAGVRDLQEREVAIPARADGDGGSGRRRLGALPVGDADLDRDVDTHLDLDIHMDANESAYVDSDTNQNIDMDPYADAYGNSYINRYPPSAEHGSDDDPVPAGNAGIQGYRHAGLR